MSKQRINISVFKTSTILVEYFKGDAFILPSFGLSYYNPISGKASVHTVTYIRSDKSNEKQAFLDAQNEANTMRSLWHDLGIVSCVYYHNDYKELFKRLDDLLDDTDFDLLDDTDFMSEDEFLKLGKV